MDAILDTFGFFAEIDQGLIRVKRTKTAFFSVDYIRLTRTGMAVRLVHSNGTAATAGTPSPGLVKHLLQAREWWSLLASGGTDITTIATTEGLNKSWVSRVVRLNFLAPEIVEAILKGEQPARLTADSLALISPLPIIWSEQRDVIAAL